MNDEYTAIFSALIDRLINAETRYLKAKILELENLIKESVSMKEFSAMYQSLSESNAKLSREVEQLTEQIEHMKSQ